jgi:two-component system chemotaxis response regulator CheY
LVGITEFNPDLEKTVLGRFMFTKAEQQIIATTLQQRASWLQKNMDNQDLSANKSQNQATLALIEGALAKLNEQLKPPAPTPTPAKAPKLTMAQRRQQMEPQQMRVLIVDDDEMIASLLQMLLRSTGIRHVDIASDGLKGISMLYDANPIYDLVLCDWHMPIKNGLDVHNAMRAAERYMETCFILVTAVTEAKQIRSAIEEGVDDYIVKPLEEQTTIKKLARHFPKLPVPTSNTMLGICATDSGPEETDKTAEAE